MNLIDVNKIYDEILNHCGKVIDEISQIQSYRYNPNILWIEVEV